MRHAFKCLIKSIIKNPFDGYSLTSYSNVKLLTTFEVSLARMKVFRCIENVLRKEPKNRRLLFLAIMTFITTFFILFIEQEVLKHRGDPHMLTYNDTRLIKVLKKNTEHTGNYSSQYWKILSFQPELEKPISKKVENNSVSENEPKVGNTQLLKIAPKKTDDTKKILLWNDFYLVKNYGLDESYLWDVNCPYKNCVLTDDKSKYDLKETDAVLWHPRGLNKSIPNLQGMKAKLVFYNVEPPTYLYMNFRLIPNKFNLMYTYREDAHVHFPYGAFVNRKKPDESFATRNFHANKTLMAVWFTSHCHTHSRREILAKTLQRNNITAHVYGLCGDLKCPIEVGTENCLKMVEDAYFFYFSFENSLCKDYVTEKVFQLLKFNMIPVVYGLGPYRKYLPPHSYIDIFDYSSVEDLANYLKYLTHNETAYNEYFRWKVNMTLIDGGTIHALSFCHLCEILNKNEAKIDIDIESWFVENSRCISGSDQPVSSFIRGERLNEPINNYIYRRESNSGAFNSYKSSIHTLYKNIK